MKKTLISLALLSLALPFAVFAEDCDPTKDLCNPLIDGSFEAIIGRLIDFLFSIAIILAPLMIVLGGYLFLTSAGDAKKVGQGRNLIIWAAVGFGTILLAKAFVSLIGVILGNK
jgi:hypothetical protein